MASLLGRPYRRRPCPINPFVLYFSSVSKKLIKMEKKMAKAAMQGMAGP
jgi:hypothetical protein